MTATWNGRDLAELLALEQEAPGHWRSKLGESNMNGRTFGGQLLGQALAAALGTVAADRAPSVMQFLFLKGASPDEPIDFSVEMLQEGRRFSSVHVRGTQGGDRKVLDAQVTCAAGLRGPEHSAESAAPPSEHPEALLALENLPPAALEDAKGMAGYARARRPSIEFRIPEPEKQLSAKTATSSLRFWIRAIAKLPPDPRVRAAAFAYMSDWWVNFSSIVAHQEETRRQSVYVASLNHTIWLHGAPQPDEWLHVHSSSPAAARGRGLSIARVHDVHGRLVASVAQEALFAYGE